MIYLDHHAATPLCAEARAAMAEVEGETWANPSSVHAAGRTARRALETARDRIAAAVGVVPADLVLTGGGTEAVNLAVLGPAGTFSRVVTTTIEHPALGAAAERRADAMGAACLRLPVPAGVPPAPADVPGGLDASTLVALGWVNHETGTRLDLARWAEACAAAGATLAVDATQALGKVEVDLGALPGVTTAAFAGSKVGGPKGAGALAVRRDVDLAPLLAGGGQERGRRPGTPDVRAQVGFGGACLAVPARLAATSSVAARRDRLERGLVQAGAVVNGEGGPRVATVTDVSFRDVRGDTLVMALDLEGVCCSSGAACSSGVAEPSPVVAAMYPDAPWRAAGALRMSLGPETSDDDIDLALEKTRSVLARGFT